MYCPTLWVLSPSLALYSAAFIVLYFIFCEISPEGRQSLAYYCLPRASFNNNNITDRVVGRPVFPRMPFRGYFNNNTQVQTHHAGHNPAQSDAIRQLPRSGVEQRTYNGDKITSVWTAVDNPTNGVSGNFFWE